jgi:hypothetical protein
LAVEPEIFLVIVLGDKECFKGRDLGHDSCLPHFLRFKVLNHLLGSRLLLWAVVKDHGTVLGPNVGSLPVQGSWVMDHEKDLQDVVEWNHPGVKGNLDHFGMPRPA